MREEARKKYKDEERPFTDEVPSETLAQFTKNPSLYKPRYYNRARYTFEWNRYNQTHYNSEKPPPKSIQGFRFNVYYPLLPVEVAPTYVIRAAPVDRQGRRPVGPDKVWVSVAPIYSPRAHLSGPNV